MTTKFIFVTGGVTSSLGKGLAAASLAALLEARGMKVTLQKLDPYLNVDPGTMNPTEHGEVFVTDDGTETDLDLGHYERFTHAALSEKSNVTSGKVYRDVIKGERKGQYLGQTVQVVPHITDEIKARILANAEGSDVALVEIGGTIGDIESLPFLEAIRQFRKDLGYKNVVYLHLTLIPYLSKAGEFKTKPTQHSVKMLREVGIQPDAILCRWEPNNKYRINLPDGIKKKIAKFCDVDIEAVIEAKDVDSIYEVPLNFHQEKLDDFIVERLDIWQKAPDLTAWKDLRDITRKPNTLETVTIGMVGKYMSLEESYKSVSEALKHGGFKHRANVKIEYIDPEVIEAGDDPIEEIFEGIDGILVPGGFGDRGTEGKILAINYARTKQIPFLGICLGMQLAVIEFTRNSEKLALSSKAPFSLANSAEFDENSKVPVIHLMHDQRNVTEKGATMRLGAYGCDLTEDTLSLEAYGEKQISERHRHRFEFNNDYREDIADAGLVIAGVNPEQDLVEIVELPKDVHPWFVACQFHPEFKSKPLNPHPLFAGLVKASIASK